MIGELERWTSTLDVRQAPWADVLSVLPHRPRTMVVLEGGERWRDVLCSAGVRERTRSEGPDVPDLAVAGAAGARAAVDSGAPTILLHGRVPAWLARSAGDVRRLLPVPHWEEPEVLVPLDRPRLAAYAFGHLLPATSPWRSLRADLLRTRPGLRALRWWPGTVSIVSREAIRPFALAAAPAASAIPADVEWLLRPGTGDPQLKRNVVYLFEPGADTPEWILKVGRRPGYAAPFERDDDAAAVLASAPPIVRSHAPAWLGTFEADGVHASLETAARGVRLLDLLRSTAPRARKLGAIDLVAAWLVEVDRATAGAPADLERERRRLTEHKLPRWTPFGAPADLADRLPPIPSAFRHGDLWTANVLIEGDAFEVIDWEAAFRRGFPVWDLLTLLTDALAVLDGCRDDDEREDHFARLYRGELPSSAVLFGWIRRAVEASAIPAEAVGAVVTLLWLDRGYRPWSGRHDAPADERPLKARLAHRWLLEPALGHGWSAWR